MSQPSDPLEERDVLKILDSLDDPRVIKKLLSIVKMEALKISQITKTETTNANKAS